MTAVDSLFDLATARRVLSVMYWTRFMDDKMSKLVRQNKGGTFHLPVAGHEMIGVLSAMALIPGTDWGLPYYRDRAFAGQSRPRRRQRPRHSG